MKDQYRSIKHIQSAAGSLDDFLDFCVWWITLPFHMLIDAIRYLHGIIGRSKAFQTFLGSTFMCLFWCTMIFLTLVFAPFPFPVWAVVTIKVLLVFSLIFPSMRGLYILDVKYLGIEQVLEDKMMTNAQKQLAVGLPDKNQPDHAAMMRQAELEIKLLELEVRKAELESEASQIRATNRVRQDMIKQEELDRKEVALGWKDAPEHIDFTAKEKQAIGWAFDRKADPVLLRAVRVIAQFMKDFRSYRVELYRVTTTRAAWSIEFSCNAIDPVMPGEGQIDSIANMIGVKFVRKAKPTEGTFAFSVSNQTINPQLAAQLEEERRQKEEALNASAPTEIQET